jgi:hypothetical protein
VFGGHHPADLLQIIRPQRPVYLRFKRPGLEKGFHAPPLERTENKGTENKARLAQYF